MMTAMAILFASLAGLYLLVTLILLVRFYNAVSERPFSSERSQDRSRS